MIRPSRMSVSGIQLLINKINDWISAFAGMTNKQENLC